MYIDPSAGSLVIQVIAATAISAVAFVGRVRTAIRTAFSSLFTRRPH